MNDKEKISTIDRLITEQNRTPSTRKSTSYGDLLKQINEILKMTPTDKEKIEESLKEIVAQIDYYAPHADHEPNNSIIIDLKEIREMLSSWKSEQLGGYIQDKINAYNSIIINLKKLEKILEK